jgi:hypothetical protein
MNKTWLIYDSHWFITTVGKWNQEKHWTFLDIKCCFQEEKWILPLSFHFFPYFFGAMKLKYVFQAQEGNSY